MAFQAGKRLPGEKASKLGHLDVVNSDLIKDVIHAFEFSSDNGINFDMGDWRDVPQNFKPLSVIFTVDGSLQVIQSEGYPKKEVAFVKTSMLRLDEKELNKIDKESPHPIALKNLMKECALYHSTLFPLKNIKFKQQNYFTAMRRLVVDSLKDVRLKGRPYDALKWIVYKKWDEANRCSSPSFECPICENIVDGLPYDADTHICPKCKGEIFVTDVLGLHMEMLEESSSSSFATSYMLIHEMLLLFSGISYFWENQREFLGECLFIKDGPLSLRGQYTKIVPLLRDFFSYAYKNSIPVYVIGQEKSGDFFDHLQGVEKFVKPHSSLDMGSYTILSNNYIKKEVKRLPSTSNQYGLKTNYGGKIYVKSNHLHSMVVNIPLVEYAFDDQYPNVASDFIGFERIMATIPTILSHRFEGALLPVELVNGITSLSSYPSSEILKVFSGI